MRCGDTPAKWPLATGRAQMLGAYAMNGAKLIDDHGQTLIRFSEIGAQMVKALDSLVLVSQLQGQHFT